MKKYRSILGIIVATVLFNLACESEPVLDVTSFDADPATAATGEEVTFTVVGEAENYVLWPGDEGGNYDTYLEQVSNPPPDTVNVSRNNDVGLRHDNIIVIDDRYEVTFTHVYEEPGTYTVVMIASTAEDFGESVKTDERRLTITVE